MKVLSLLLVCTVLDMAPTEGSAIMKALVGQPESGHHRHRHGHGYGHHRQQQQQPAGDRQATLKPHQTTDTHQELVKELNNELRRGLPINPAMLSSRVSFGRVKPELPPLEMRVDADSWVGRGETLDYLQLEEQLVGQDPDLPDLPDLPTGNTNHQRGAQQQSTMPAIAADVADVYNGSTSPTTLSRQVPTSPAPDHDDAGSGDVSSSGDSVEDVVGVGAARARRSLTADLVQVPVCESVSEWVERTAADDMWGNTVRVLQEIDIGGTLVNQYFYETYCREKRASCMGIDTSKYRSVCRNKHMWAYAKVETRSGDVGWNLIRIRGSCNCALYMRYPKERFDITKLIGKR